MNDLILSIREAGSIVIVVAYRPGVLIARGGRLKIIDILNRGVISADGLRT